MQQSPEMTLKIKRQNQQHPHELAGTVIHERVIYEATMRRLLVLPYLMMIPIMRIQQLMWLMKGAPVMQGRIIKPWGMMTSWTFDFSNISFDVCNITVILLHKICCHVMLIFSCTVVLCLLHYSECSDNWSLHCSHLLLCDHPMHFMKLSQFDCNVVLILPINCISF